MDSCAVLVYAMELKPYIEEPLSRALPSSSVNSSDLRPRIRHDFILSTMEVVDNYWKTLEYCYAAADPVAALQAFPGSAVHEVCDFSPPKAELYGFYSVTYKHFINCILNFCFLSRLTDDLFKEIKGSKECIKWGECITLP